MMEPAAEETLSQMMRAGLGVSGQTVARIESMPLILQALELAATLDPVDGRRLLLSQWSWHDTPDALLSLAFDGDDLDRELWEHARWVIKQMIPVAASDSQPVLRAALRASRLPGGAHCAKRHRASQSIKRLHQRHLYAGRTGSSLHEQFLLDVGMSLLSLQPVVAARDAVEAAIVALVEIENRDHHRQSPAPTSVSFVDAMQSRLLSRVLPILNGE